MYHYPTSGPAPVIQGNFRNLGPAFALQPQGGVETQQVGHATKIPEAIRFGQTVGKPMPTAVQQKMESFFGTDFSDVRVHEGPEAANIGALAFTLGRDIYFAPGQYQPHASHGQRLLGHELTHVVQQRAGRVRNPFGSGVAIVQDPGMEAEADRMGLRAASYQLSASPSSAQAKRASEHPIALAPPAPKAPSSPAQAKTAQPYIAKGSTVYYSSETQFGQGTSENNFKRSLKVMASQSGTNVNTATSTSWNRFATTQAGYEARAMGGPRGGRNQRKVKAQFLDTQNVYCYAANADIQGLAPGSTWPLLTFADMAEANGAALPNNVNHQSLAEAKCVIESLEDMGAHVPNTQSGTVPEWHTHFTGQNLDYRQDNNYIVVYVQSLGFRLRETNVKAWNNWTPAVGNYIVMSYPSAQTIGAVGHAIGVAVTQGNNGIVKTRHDRQGLSDNWNTIYIKYVFEIP